MLILDTDHLSEIDRGSNSGMALLERLGQIEDRVATTIVSVEEQLRGLLALIRKAPETTRAISYYVRLHRFLADLHEWDILAMDEAAAAVFERLRRNGVKAGTMDLRIASIALAQNATLLSRNVRDFERIPDLQVENWLDAR